MYLMPKLLSKAVDNNDVQVYLHRLDLPVPQKDE